MTVGQMPDHAPLATPLVENVDNFIYPSYKGIILKSIHIAHSMEGDMADKKQFAWVTLYIASHQGHFRLVAELLRECLLGINARIPTGWTALHAAARKGHWGVLCILLDKGT